jgi:hypothetical protein
MYDMAQHVTNTLRPEKYGRMRRARPISTIFGVGLLMHGGYAAFRPAGEPRKRRRWGSATLVADIIALLSRDLATLNRMSSGKRYGQTWFKFAPYGG